MNRRTRSSGTTLVEILVVIVVFLVGILAIIQVFPPGLNLLRTTRNNTVAAQFGSSMMQRVLSQPGQLAEMILPVTYVSSVNGLRVVVNTSRLNSDLLPDKDPGNLPGQIDSTGNVLVGGLSIGNWMRVSGPNLFSRVIGESRPVPAPRRVPGLPVGSDYGGLLQLTFSPTYYFQNSQGVGEPGIVLAYGNDLVRRYGDREEDTPNPTGRWRDWEFFFVDGSESDQTYFPGEDQLWVAPQGVRDFRIAFSFAYLDPNTNQITQYDVIVQAPVDPASPPPYAQVAGNYWVISLQQLIAQPDVFGNPSQFVAGNFRGAERGSTRLARVFRELPMAAAFSGDPYEYKVIGASGSGLGVDYCMGTLLVSPAAFDYKFRTDNGLSIPLEARVDYTVLDWRIIQDEFRVPSASPYNVKLSLSSIKPRSGTGPDAKPNPGLGLNTPSLLPAIPNKTEDVIVVDVDSGGLIMGNVENDPSKPGFPQAPQSGWQANKSNGFITFRDVDNDASNGLSAYMVYPTGDPLNPWSPQVLVNNVSNRNVRVLYMGVGEWAPQISKAARSYRVSWYLRANGLGPGECLVGGTPDANNNPQGQNHRIYFPLNDLNQRVIIGEVWYSTGGGPQVLADQEFGIDGTENVNGTLLGYADIRSKAAGAVFDTVNGYTVRRVRGASVKVRVLWNPATFFLGSDQVSNYNNLEEWMRNWRRSETESFRAGGKR